MGNRSYIDERDGYTAINNQQASEENLDRAQKMNRPSYILRPTLTIDGNRWCALYGADLMTGVAAFGESPEDAYLAFDEAWTTPIKIGGAA